MTPFFQVNMELATLRQRESISAKEPGYDNSSLFMRVVWNSKKHTTGEAEGPGLSKGVKAQKHPPALHNSSHGPCPTFPLRICHHVTNHIVYFPLLSLKRKLHRGLAFASFVNESLGSQTVQPCRSAQ